MMEPKFSGRKEGRTVSECPLKDPDLPRRDTFVPISILLLLDPDVFGYYLGSGSVQCDLPVPISIDEQCLRTLFLCCILLLSTPH